MQVEETLGDCEWLEEEQEQECAHPGRTQRPHILLGVSWHVIAFARHLLRVLQPQGWQE